MFNIKLYPEGACYVPGKGSEKELQDIVSQYLDILKKKKSDETIKLKVPSLNDISFEKELDDAYDYIVNAANNGDVDAEHTLKQIEYVLDTFPNYFVIQSEFDTNVWYATHSDIYAQGMLGDKYYYGKGIDQNYEEAVKWYRKSAEQGVKQAQYNLAGCFEEGFGVKQNREEALKWYKKAAEKGLWEAKRAVKRIEIENSNPDESLLTYLPTNIWEGELENSWKDEYGVTYSADGKRLLDAPKELHDYKVKDGTQVICDSAFYECERLSRIELPNSLVTIGSGAFTSCQSLKSIKFPPHIREIGEGAFEYSGLICIDIPDGLEFIGDEAFRECYHLKSISLPRSLKEIGNGVFEWCKILESIKIDINNPYYDSRDECNAVIETNTNVLIAGCSGTRIPNSVVKIGENAFWGCDNMISIDIPNSVKEIGEQAFFKCEELKSVVMGTGVERIGVRAFEECTHLVSISMSTNLKEICDSSFHECCSLVELNLPESLTTIGDNAFASCHALEKIVIPSGIKKLGSCVFAHCHLLESLTILSKLVIIGTSAFIGSNIKELILPSSVRLIEEDAFAECEQLQKVKFLREEPDVEIEENAFYGCEKLKSIYVQNGLRGYYERLLPELKDIITEQ